VDADGLGVGDADGEVDGDAVDDAGTTGRLDRDGLADADGEVLVSRGGADDVTVSAAGTISAGTGPRDVTFGDGDASGNTGAGIAGPGVREARTAAALGWNCIAD
jgi:hypothetical protein